MKKRQFLYFLYHTKIVSLIYILFSILTPSFLYAVPQFLNIPWCRIGISQITGLPNFLGIGEEGSFWIEKNLMPPDTSALLQSPGGCKFVSITTEGSNRITSTWNVGPDALPINLTYETAGNEFRLWFSRKLDERAPVKLFLRIPLNPFVTSTTFLSSTQDENGNFILPGILSAPDHGQLSVQPFGSYGKKIRVQLVGSREKHLLTLLFYFTLSPGEETGIALLRYEVPEIPGVLPEHQQTVGHAWFNIFVPRAENDTTLFNKPFLSTYKVPGLFANNTLSDPVSSCWFLPADMAFLTQDTPVLSIRRFLLHSLSYWMDNKTMDRGVAIGWTTRDHFLDPNASIIISAWDIVGNLNDDIWLKKYIRKLEILANFLASRDIDNDGIVEGEEPGTPHALSRGMLSTNAVDAINFGYKDAYSNALIYRAWACLADLEKRLGNKFLSEFYKSLAVKLKTKYYTTFFNPKTGMIAGWIDAEGRMVNYRFPFMNGLAVYSGLVPKDKAKELMQHTVDAIKNAGFTKYDFGVPITLDPIEPFDYTYKGLGYPDPDLPNKNWQMFLNGGVMQSGQGWYLLGLIRAGLKDEGCRLLNIMLPNQKAGKFQNGIINKYPDGAEVKTWEGKTCGYEGYLVHDYYYLLAAAMMDDSVAKRLFRPVWEE